MRRPIVAGNWKMNLLVPEAKALVSRLAERVKSYSDRDVVLAPPFTALSAVRELLTGTGIILAGQNIYSEPGGAYTGEISAAMLKDAGCRYVILGHSERRTFFSETDSLINQKIKGAFASGLKVLFCLGETLEQRESGVTPEVVEKQLKNGLDGLSLESMQNLVIAYEPVWAIGTGKTASPEQAQGVHGMIRRLIKKSFGEEVSRAPRIQYGGSVSAENCRELMAQSDIDGVLVGSASLNADSFYDIIISSN